jgi:hypothetical protein
MSAFIGPIHYWLYEKIRLVSQREDYIYHKAYEQCGSTAEEHREQVWQVYGAPLPDADLSELIDHDNIHGWLQRQIKIVESREAAFIKELLDACGDHNQGIIKQAFIEHGKVTGEKVKLQDKYDTKTAPGIYKALNDYYLNGMPCDQADEVVDSEPDRIAWKRAVCLQEPNWKRSGIDTEIMSKLYQSWMKAFIGAVNSEFSYRQDGSKYEIFRTK